MAGFFVLVVGQLVDDALQLAYSTLQLADNALQLVYSICQLADDLLQLAVGEFLHFVVYSSMQQEILININ